jgi:hypothetical protein
MPASGRGGGVPPSPPSPTHWPWLQGPAQLRQVAPPTPQARGEVPFRHCPFSQHPVGQLSTSQVAVTQAPFWQRWPLAQRVHMLPLDPQVALPCVLGARQNPCKQQPVQVPGPHGAVMQAPATHWSDRLHLTHFDPLAPQAKGESPGTHRPAAVWQPQPASAEPPPAEPPPVGPPPVVPPPAVPPPAVPPPAVPPPAVPPPAEPPPAEPPPVEPPPVEPPPAEPPPVAGPPSGSRQRESMQRAPARQSASLPHCTSETGVRQAVESASAEPSRRRCCFMGV